MKFKREQGSIRVNGESDVRNVEDEVDIVRLLFNIMKNLGMKNLS